MTLIANDAVQAFLGQARERTEIRGPDGQLLGYYEPRQETEDELYARAKKLFDLDELKRIKETDQEGYTIDQVMEHLRSLESH
jgi:hypothetical protein